MHTGAPKKRGEVRERVLQLAESAILEKGFGATSIEELIAAAGITKSGFFYHFKDKTELARILLTRYIEREDALFDDLFRRADELAVDTGMSNTFFARAVKVRADMIAISRTLGTTSLAFCSGR